MCHNTTYYNKNKSMKNKAKKEFYKAIRDKCEEGFNELRNYQIEFFILVSVLGIDGKEIEGAKYEIL